MWCVDGGLSCTLVNFYRPDLVDMERVQIQSNRENLEQAFEVAERLGVTRLLDAEGESRLKLCVCSICSLFLLAGSKKCLTLSLSDVDVPSPDEKSVITYVSSIYDAFPKVPEGGARTPPVTQLQRIHESHAARGTVAAAESAVQDLRGGA